jgi:hypothetical protein
MTKAKEKCECQHTCTIEGDKRWVCLHKKTMMIMIASCKSFMYFIALGSHKGWTRYQYDNNQWKSWMVVHMHDQKKVMKVISPKVSMFFWKEEDDDDDDDDDDDCKL